MRTLYCPGEGGEVDNKTAGFVDEHKANADRWDLRRLFLAWRDNVLFSFGSYRTATITAAMMATPTRARVNIEAMPRFPGDKGRKSGANFPAIAIGKPDRHTSRHAGCPARPSTSSREPIARATGSTMAELFRLGGASPRCTAWRARRNPRSSAAQCDLKMTCPSPSTIQAALGLPSS